MLDHSSIYPRLVLIYQSYSQEVQNKEKTLSKCPFIKYTTEKKYLIRCVYNSITWNIVYFQKLLSNSQSTYVSYTRFKFFRRTQMNYITTAHNKCKENGLRSGNKFSLLDQAVMKLLVKVMSIHHGGRGRAHWASLSRGTKDITGDSLFVSEWPSWKLKRWQIQDMNGGKKTKRAERQVQGISWNLMLAISEVWFWQTVRLTNIQRLWELKPVIIFCISYIYILLPKYSNALKKNNQLAFFSMMYGIHNWPRRSIYG